MNSYGNYHSPFLLGRKRVKEVTWNKRLLSGEKVYGKESGFAKKWLNEECMNNWDKNLVSSKARGRMCHLFQKYLKIEKGVITVGGKKRPYKQRSHQHHILI